jgi:hypothetical protein
MVGCDERNFDVDCEECRECPLFDDCWYEAGEEEHADVVIDDIAEYGYEEAAICDEIANSL